VSCFAFASDAAERISPWSHVYALKFRAALRHGEVANPRRRSRCVCESNPRRFVWPTVGDGGTTLCASVRLDGKRLLLVTLDPHALALALDLATGAVAWTYGL
jgi:hypothetical protein